MLRRICSASLSLLVMSTGAAAQSGKAAPVTISVAVESRQGFVDADNGVLDSIKDLQGALRRKTSLRVVSESASSQLRLWILERGSAGTRNLGTVATPIGNQRWYLPLNDELLQVTTMLEVGSYRKPFVCVNDSWRDCAKDLAKDIDAWVVANRAQLAALAAPAAQAPSTSPADITCGAWMSAYRADEPTRAQTATNAAVLAWAEEMVTAHSRSALAASLHPTMEDVEGRLLAKCLSQPLSPIGLVLAEILAPYPR